jgi:hypothetical protein
MLTDGESVGRSSLGGQNLKDRRKPAVKHDQQPAILVREPDTALEPAPQNSYLMPKYRVLSLKPHLRLDWRGQDSQDETQKPDHSASLSDSVTSSTRMRFSVHTPVTHGRNETADTA